MTTPITPSSLDPFIPEPLFRPLRVFAFDPSRGSGTSNVMTVRVPYERLRPGPVGRRVAVIDYDGPNDRFYRPVDLDDARVAQAGGLDPNESDPRFHQQMVYAVVSHTLRTFDRALGREVRFRFQRNGRGRRDHQHLRLYPHGVSEANAYYSHRLRGLVFGYFSAEPGTPRSVPDQTVFTCLSHDIAVHETCHAVLDGMREYFLQPTNPDTLPFHEAFADTIALLQHFTFSEPVLDTIQRTGGRLYRATVRSELEDDTAPPPSDDPESRNPLVELAVQFGEALGTRRALRSAIGTEADPTALQRLTEPHARGAILVAAMFDAYFRLYVRRTRDLFRLARVGPERDSDLDPDLANRLCQEATRLARELIPICIRAIELCPPVDMELGDYLRAVVTVQARMDPDDRDGFRDALIGAFARRGIYPPDVRSFGEAELLWKPPPRPLTVPDKIVNALRAGYRDAKGQERLAQALAGWCDAYRDELGLDRRLKIAVRSFHAVRLHGAELEFTQDYVCELIQSDELSLPGESVTVRGGTTLVIANDGRIRYAIAKQLNKARRAAQLEYLANRDVTAAARYSGGAPSLDLHALHRGF